MLQKPIPRNVLQGLLITAIVLPMLVMGLVGLGELMKAFGDAGSGSFFKLTALLGGILWMLDVVVMVMTLAHNAILESKPEEPDHEDT